jgi:hypothetical protein
MLPLCGRAPFCIGTKLQYPKIRVVAILYINSLSCQYVTEVLGVEEGRGW